MCVCMDPLPSIKGFRSPLLLWLGAGPRLRRGAGSRLPRDAAAEGEEWLSHSHDPRTSQLLDTNLAPGRSQGP